MIGKRRLRFDQSRQTEIGGRQRQRDNTSRDLVEKPEDTRNKFEAGDLQIFPC